VVGIEASGAGDAEVGATVSSDVTGGSVRFHGVQERCRTDSYPAIGRAALGGRTGRLPRATADG
jgi:hypothetical protein